jgi:MFS family permease
VLLCIFQALGYAQHFIVIAIIALYAQELGGTPSGIGMVVAMFGVVGIVARPLMGRLSDRYGEVRVMIVGTVIKGLSAALFMIPSVALVGLVNGLRGLGWAGLNVGGYSLLAVIIPADRRGEASGDYRGVQLGMAVIFPAAALWMLDATSRSFKLVFFVNLILAAIGTVVGLYMLKGWPQKTRESTTATKSSGWANFVDPLIVLPLSLHVLLHVSQNSVTTFAVPYAREIGIDNVGWLFVTSGIATILAQFFLGKLSDTFGRWPTIGAAFILHAAAFCFLSATSGLVGLLTGGVLYNIGLGIGATATQALCMTRASEDPSRRGQIMAGFSISFPMSNIIGGVTIGGSINIFGYPGMYMLMGGISAAGLLLTLVKRNSLK